jgi:nucleotide-binding universal stress UspA family protein
MLGTVVVGVDATATSRDAVAAACALARDVVLVHAYPYDLLPLPGTVVEVDVAQQSQAQAEAFVAGLRDELAPGARVRVLPDTSPGRALHEVCEEEGADLLVVGSSQSAHEGRAQPGAVSQGALHHAPCPVLVTARGGWGDGRLAAIGVGYDGSDGSHEALRLADRLAAITGARLRLITVVPHQDGVVEARRALEDVAEDCAAPAVADAAAGDAEHVLAQRSAELDVLVLGSRGWGPVRRLLLGSTSDRVVRDAGCAVLVVPRGER